MLLNEVVSSSGKRASSSTRLRRRPTILSTCSIITGHASTHAPQVTQSHTASNGIAGAFWPGRNVMPRRDASTSTRPASNSPCVVLLNFAALSGPADLLTLHQRLPEARFEAALEAQLLVDVHDVLLGRPPGHAQEPTYLLVCPSDGHQPDDLHLPICGGGSCRICGGPENDVEVHERRRPANDRGSLLLGDRLVGAYLFGSATRDDFDRESDVDVVMVTTQDLPADVLVALGAMHTRIAGLDSRWATQLEVSYIPTRAIRRYDPPDVVLGHDPWKRYRLHPDHRHAGLLTCDSVVAARDPHFFPEQGLEPHRPSALLLWEADEVDHVEDVAGHEDAKLAALLEHRSQFRSTMDIGDAEAAEEVHAFRERMLARLADHGALAGLARGEAFKLVRKL